MKNYYEIKNEVRQREYEMQRARAELINDRIEKSLRELSECCRLSEQQLAAVKIEIDSIVSLIDSL